MRLLGWLRQNREAPPPVTYDRNLPGPVRVGVAIHDPTPHGLRLGIRHGRMVHAGRNIGPVRPELGEAEVLDLGASDVPASVDCLPERAGKLQVSCYHGTESRPAGVVADEHDGTVDLRCFLLDRDEGQWQQAFAATLTFEPLRDVGPGPAPEATRPAAVPDRAGLPEFRYHIDPVRSGAVEPSDRACAVCGRQRGWRYMGPIFTALEEIEEAQDAGELVICPWCIADGRAAAAYDARFVELAVIHRRPGVPAEVVEEVERRTPGFRPLFGPYWVRHHGDACAFVITVTSENLPQLSPEEQEAIRDERQALEGDHPAPVYLFRCLHCGRYLTHE